MKPFYVIGNWKSNKTEKEALDWLMAYAGQVRTHPIAGTIFPIICVPFTLLSPCHDFISTHTVPLSLAAQDVSPFSRGAYTGEVTADMVKEFAEYVLIGHSERRKYFQENDEELHFEMLQAHEAGLKIVYCIEEVTTIIPDMVDIVAFEPPTAIGSGKPQDSRSVGELFRSVRERIKKPMLYGGSVDQKSVFGFYREEGIDGVLVGGASLVEETFFRLITSIA